MQNFIHAWGITLKSLKQHAYYLCRMLLKYTQNTLDKVERIIEDNNYIIRYEKGSFQSGYCILREKKVVVVNKFFPIEGRINTLIDLLPQLEINIDSLTHDSQKFYTDLIAVRA